MEIWACSAIRLRAISSVLGGIKNSSESFSVANNVSGWLNRKKQNSQAFNVDLSVRPLWVCFPCLMVAKWGFNRLTFGEYNGARFVGMGINIELGCQGAYKGIHIISFEITADAFIFEFG